MRRLQRRVLRQGVPPGEGSGGQKVELPDGRIAFRRYLDGAQTHGAIFTINPDGTGEKQLTDPPEGVVDDQPDWSPDGTQIAFERCSEDEPCWAYTVPADGGKPEKVRARCTLKPICDLASPAWTPDGNLVVNLAQGREREVGGEGQIQHSSLALLDLKRGTQKTFIRRTGWPGDTQTPAISPDGRTIVYKRWNSQLSKQPPRGPMGCSSSSSTAPATGSSRLGSSAAATIPCSRRTAGSSFAPTKRTKANSSNFWTVGPDGEGLKQLTHFKDGTLVLSTSYSHDGTWIVHATNGEAEEADIFVMRADGTGNRAVTRTESWDSAPDWGPAGS